MATHKRSTIGAVLIIVCTVCAASLVWSGLAAAQVSAETVLEVHRRQAALAALRGDTRWVGQFAIIDGKVYKDGVLVETQPAAPADKPGQSKTSQSARPVLKESIYYAVGADFKGDAKLLPNVTHACKLNYTSDDYAWAKRVLADNGIKKTMNAYQVVTALQKKCPTPAKFENAVAKVGAAFFITSHHVGFTQDGFLSIRDVPFKELSKGYSNCMTHACWRARVFKAAGYEARVMIGGDGTKMQHAWCEIYSGATDVRADAIQPVVPYRTRYQVKHYMVTYKPGGPAGGALNKNAQVYNPTVFPGKSIWGVYGSPKAPVAAPDDNASKQVTISNKP